MQDTIADMLPAIKLDGLGSQQPHLLDQNGRDRALRVGMRAVKPADMNHAGVRVVTVCIRRKIGEIGHHIDLLLTSMTHNPRPPLLTGFREGAGKTILTRSAATNGSPQVANLPSTLPEYQNPNRPAIAAVSLDVVFRHRYRNPGVATIAVGDRVKI